MKRKSLSKDSDIEKKKKRKKAITPRSKAQSSKSLCGICLDSVIDSKIFTNIHAITFFVLSAYPSMLRFKEKKKW